MGEEDFTTKLITLYLLIDARVDILCREWMLGCILCNEKLLSAYRCWRVETEQTGDCELLISVGADRIRL